MATGEMLLMLIIDGTSDRLAKPEMSSCPATTVQRSHQTVVMDTTNPVAVGRPKVQESSD
jgi:hypothetical protein